MVAEKQGSGVSLRRAPFGSEPQGRRQSSRGQGSELFDGIPSNRASKRPRAKKLGKPLGPFQTVCTSFSCKERAIEIVRLTDHAIVYRLVGQAGEYFLSHATAFQRAVCLEAGFDAGPREGSRIKRGGVQTG